MSAISEPSTVATVTTSVVPEHQWDVTVLGGVDDEQAHARVVEDRLGDDRAAHDGGEGQAEQGQDGDQARCAVRGRRAPVACSAPLAWAVRM